MKYHPDLKKALVIILAVVLLFLGAVFIGGTWGTSTVDYKDPEILGKLDLTSTITCRQNTGEIITNLYFDAKYRQSYHCNLSNKPNVVFELRFSCNDARNGQLCMIKMEPSEVKKR